MADLPPYPGTPMWAKVFGILTMIVVLLFFLLLFTRGPGGRHGAGGPAASGTADPASSSIMEGDTLIDGGHR